mmetsp:Transcript_16521/g.28886  ORF Transcript_16521/g.28886 Transcript_16521/m.28886 type:complete len:543 (+) Transcript_16521:56-1684(+)
MLLHPVNEAIGLLENDLQMILDGGSEKVGSPSNVPVAAALRCTMFLTTLFFSVYMTVICLRLGSMASGQGQAPASRSSWESRVAKAAGSLYLAPVVAILMISTRLRAMELAKNAQTGEPPMWAQACMYAASMGFLVRFVADVSMPATQGRVNRNSESLVTKTLRIVRNIFGGIIYASSCAIIMSTLTMEAPSGTTEALGCIMQCLLVLAGSHLFESGARDVYQAMPSRTADSEVAGYGAAQGLSQKDDSDEGLPAGISLQFSPMLCVLFVGIALRAVQLNLEPELWAMIAMYATTFAMLLQAARDTMRTVTRKGRTEDRPQQLLADEAAGPVRAAPGMEQDDGADASFWSATTLCIYVGTALIMVCVFAMEPKPLSILIPSGSSSSPSGKVESQHPISTAMRCVMSLTVVYFTAYLVLMAGSLTKGVFGRWASHAASSVQRSLAFAPMLCVMMIGVRLRAMQIGERDPPRWAQVSMVIATVAVVTQVACSMLSEGEQNGDDKALASKIYLITLLVMRYAASLALFLGVGSLIISLAWMQPVL